MDTPSRPALHPALRKGCGAVPPSQVSPDLGRGPDGCSSGRQVKAGGCAAVWRWRGVGQPDANPESHLEVPRRDVSLLLGLRYTYTCFKPPLYFMPPVAAPGARRDAFVSLSFTSSLFSVLKQELALLRVAGLNFEILRNVS